MIALIADCGNNFASLQFALKRLGFESIVTNDPFIIQNAQYVILPGVGSSMDAMRKLKRSGLNSLIPALKQPVLGICLGMQLLFEHSEEGDTPCLGIIPGSIRKLPKAPKLSIPHMGWNQLQLIEAASPLLSGILPENYVYFVHSYFADIQKHTLASTDYGIHFSAIVRHRNFYGMQFHPEKSGTAGAQLLSNFLTRGGVTC